MSFSYSRIDYLLHHRSKRCFNCFKKISGDDFDLIDGEKHCSDCYPLCLKIHQRLSRIKEDKQKDAARSQKSKDSNNVQKEKPTPLQVETAPGGGSSNVAEHEGRSRPNPTSPRVKDRMKAFSQFEGPSDDAREDRIKSVPVKAKKISRFGGFSVPKCKVCGRTAYLTESIKIEDTIYHKNCFRCLECNSKLTMQGFAQINSNLYCKPHFKQKFHSSGGKYDRAFGTRFTNSSDPDAVVLTDDAPTLNAASKRGSLPPKQLSPQVTETSTVDPTSPTQTHKRAKTLPKSFKQKPAEMRSQSAKNIGTIQEEEQTETDDSTIHEELSVSSDNDFETEEETETEDETNSEAEEKSFLKKMNPFSKRKSSVAGDTAEDKETELSRLRGLVAEYERKEQEQLELEILKQQELRTRSSSVDAKLDRLEAELRERDLRIKTLDMLCNEYKTAMNKSAEKLKEYSDEEQQKRDEQRKHDEQRKLDEQSISQEEEVKNNDEQSIHMLVEKEEKKSCDGENCEHFEQVKQIRDDFERDFLTLKIELCNTVDKMHDIEMANMRLRTEQMQILSKYRSLQQGNVKVKKKRFKRKKKKLDNTL